MNHFFYGSLFSSSSAFYDQFLVATAWYYKLVYKLPNVSHQFVRNQAYIPDFSLHWIGSSIFCNTWDLIYSFTFFTFCFVLFNSVLQFIFLLLQKYYSWKIFILNFLCFHSVLCQKHIWFCKKKIVLGEIIWKRDQVFKPK